MWKQHIGWIDELLKQVQIENIVQPPKFPVELQELHYSMSVIGRVPQGLRAMYLVFRDYERHCEELRMNFAVENEAEGDAAEIAKLEMVGNALESIFWVSLREALGLADLSAPIDVAGYWRVVVHESVADQCGIATIPEFAMQCINDN